MFIKSFRASAHVYRKYLITPANTTSICYNLLPVRNFDYCSITSKHRAPPVITCSKCQVQRHYSRGILDGDILDLQNAQKERELTHLAKIFPNSRVTLNELAARCPDNVFDIQYKQASVAPKAARKKTVQNDWTCTYTFVWPQKIKFESTAKSKRQAAEKAALQAIHWLHANKRIDNKGHPVFDKRVIEELNNSLHEPLRASISEKSMEKISKIWENYETEISEIYRATFEAAKRRAVATPAAFTKDSTIDEEDDASDSEYRNEADNVSELKIPVHPVYGKHVSPPTKTALDRRKRQLTKTFETYDEERTPLPIDEYRWPRYPAQFPCWRAVTFNSGSPRSATPLSDLNVTSQILKYIRLLVVWIWGSVTPLPNCVIECDRVLVINYYVI